MWLQQFCQDSRFALYMIFLKTLVQPCNVAPGLIEKPTAVFPQRRNIRIPPQGFLFALRENAWVGDPESSITVISH